jgi:hypothetical protein
VVHDLAHAEVAQLVRALDVDAAERVAKSNRARR